MKSAWWTAVALLLAACGAGGGKSDDAYAGLDQAIRQWRAELLKSEPACRGKTEQGNENCQQFEVSCKVENPIAPAEAAAGVTQKVLAAMTWSEPDPAVGGRRPASAVAVFSRAGQGDWTRKPAQQINVRTCAPL